MALGKYLFFGVVIFNTYASKLNTLITKQAVDKIRYISENSKNMIYQKRNGIIALSTNFAVNDLIKGTPQTYYFVTTSKFGKMALIEKDDYYLTGQSIRRKKEIYQNKIGTTKTFKIGEGISPKLYLQDSWASFYDPFRKIIFFKSLVNNVLDFEIKLRNPISPYFIPYTEIIDNNRILFTDINEKGNVGIFLFTRSTKKITIIHKSEEVGKYFEFCTSLQKLYIGEFSQEGIRSSSQITELDLNKSLDYTKGRIIYESALQDYGKLTCHQNKKLYFIKSFSNSKNIYEFTSELVELDPVSKKLMTLSDLKHVTQFIYMDQRILIPYRGKFYIALGDPLQDDSFK